jgi:hypothetical protein
MATLGEDVTLECEVDAHPIPKLSFSRDSSAVDKVGNSSKYDVRILRESRVNNRNYIIRFKRKIGAKLTSFSPFFFPLQEPDANYIMQLTIRNMNVSDSGVYYCNAQNNFGTFAQVMKLQARQKAVK